MLVTTVNALFYKHVTFSLFFIAVQQQQQSKDDEWKQRSVKDPPPNPYTHTGCVWVVMAALHTGPPNSTLHNIARCAFVESMWLLMRRCRVVVVVVFFLLTETLGGMWTAAGRCWTGPDRRSKRLLLFLNGFPENCKWPKMMLMYSKLWIN